LASVASAYTFPDFESAYNRPSVNFSCVMFYISRLKKVGGEIDGRLTLFLSVGVGPSCVSESEPEKPLPHWYTSP
jgi:hypothetical protein